MPRIRRTAASRALAAAFALWAGASAAQPQADRPTYLPFHPPLGETVTYRAVERETSVFPGKEIREGWRQTIDLTPIRALPEGGFEATVTIREVALETGRDDDMLYRVARALEGRPVTVRLDRGGYVAGIVGWPSVKADLKAALARRTGAGEARATAAVLDRLDASDGHSIVARPLLLASAGYMAPIRRDGKTAEIRDYQGAAAYIFPGRTLTSGIIGIDTEANRVGVGWKISTDPAIAARELRPLLMNLLPTVGLASPGDVPRAQQELSRMLSDGKLELDEDGAAGYDVNRHIIRKAVHRMTLKASGYRRETVMELERVEP